MENISRRDLVKKLGIGTAVAGVVGLVGITEACSTSTILADLDTIVQDGIILATTLQTSPVIGAVAVLVLAYASKVKTAVDAAITINNDKSLSTAQKAAQIAELFANLALANIPGLPSLIAPLVGAVEVAINTLLGLLRSPSTAAFVKTNPRISLSLSKTGAVSSDNKKFGDAIAKAAAAAAAANVGAK